MLTQQFLSRVRSFLAYLNAHSDGLETLTKIGNEYAAIAAEFDSLLTIDPPTLAQQRSNVIKKVSHAAETIAASSFYRLYRDLDAIQAAVTEFLNTIPNAEFPTLYRVKQGIADFRELLQEFLAQKHKPLDTLRVVVAARTLAELLQSIEETFRVVDDELEYQAPEDAETVTLVYEATPDLASIVKLLEALLSIWDEIARELGIEPERPTVARLETGSLFAIIVGSPLAVAVLTLLVTQWGRIKTFLDPVGSASITLKAAVDLATLSDFLNGRGIDTSNIDKMILRIAQNQAPKLSLATDRIVSVRRNADDMAIVDTMRLLDNKQPPPPLIEYKPNEPS